MNHYNHKLAVSKVGHMNKRAKRIGAEGRVQVVEILPFFESHEQFCHWCKREINFRLQFKGRVNRQATFDHIVAMSRGGRNTMDNIVPSCYACNNLREIIDSYEGTRKQTRAIIGRLMKSGKKGDILPLLFKSCNRDYWEFRARQIDISKGDWYTPPAPVSTGPCDYCSFTNGHLAYCFQYKGVKS